MDNKDQKLLNKINDLCEKLEQEENPLKRGIYVAKLDFLLARVQKELDIAQIKEEHQQKREEIKQKFNEEKRQKTKDKQDAIVESDSYKRKLIQNSRYDPHSPDFVFFDELNDVGGDWTKLVEELRNNGDEEIANRIETAVSYRQGYEEAEENLEKHKEEGRSIRQEAFLEENKDKIKETSLILKKRVKVNLFTRIFNGIKTGFKEIKRGFQEIIKQTNFELDLDDQVREKRAEENKLALQEIQELDGKYNNEMQALQDLDKEYNKKILELTAKYEEEIKKLQEQYKKPKQELQEKYANLQKEIQSRHIQNVEDFENNKREEFRKRMVNEEASKNTSKIVEDWLKMKEENHQNQDNNKDDNQHINY